MKNLIIISFLLVVGLKGFGQSLSKTWQSVNHPYVVLIFDSAYQCVSICYNIEDNNQCEKGKKRITYKKVDNLIYMKWYNNQNFCCWTSDKYTFSINKITEDSLSLTLLKSTFTGMEELLAIASTNIPIEFIAIEDGCPPFKKKQ